MGGAQAPKKDQLIFNFMFKSKSVFFLTWNSATLGFSLSMKFLCLECAFLFGLNQCALAFALASDEA